MKPRKPLTEEQKEQKRIRENNYYHTNKGTRIRKPLTEEQKLKDAERKRKYYERNRDLVIERAKKQALDNYEQKLEYGKQYYQLNKDKKSEYRKQYRANPLNKTRLNAKHNIRTKERCQNEPLFKLKRNIRSSINRLIKAKGFKKNSKTEQILGCTFEQFKQHLESQFEPWMNWNNYGNWNGVPTEPNTAWDIDHHIPVSSALTENELLQLNHYTNLKPLCSYTNRWIKSDNL